MAFRALVPASRIRGKKTKHTGSKSSKKKKKTKKKHTTKT
jgi:hypothetical protein